MSYFSLEEMRCRDGTPYPDRWRGDRWPELQSTLDAIREKWNAPIVIVSGYRTPAHNKGAKRSQHICGRAADIRPAGADFTVFNVRRLWAMIGEMHEDEKLPLLGGLGRYLRWVHVDTRPSRRGKDIARWSKA